MFLAQFPKETLLRECLWNKREPYNYVPAWLPLTSIELSCAGELPSGLCTFVSFYCSSSCSHMINSGPGDIITNEQTPKPWTSVRTLNDRLANWKKRVELETCWDYLVAPSNWTKNAKIGIFGTSSVLLYDAEGQLSFKLSHYKINFDSVILQFAAVF